MLLYVYVHERGLMFILNHSLCFPDPTKHTPEVHLSKQSECVTRTSAKRKRSDETPLASKKQKTSELEHETPSEEESLPDTEYELYS